MGILCQSLAGGTLKMKTVALLSLIAVAFAEPEAEAKADPWVTYGYGLGHYGYGYARPYYGGYAGWYGKRSAEAEPEARLMPTPTCCTEDTVWDTTATGPTATPTLTDTTARGPPRPSPRPRPTPG